MKDQVYEFYLVIPLGLEGVALSELQSWVQLDSKAITRSKGGISLLAPLEVGLSLNLVLKVPTRILLRLKKFKCTDFEKLYQKLKKIPWGDYATKGEVQWKISSKTSRLFHKRRLLEVCNKAYTKYRIGQPPRTTQGSEPQAFHVQFYDDICTLSVDTSGEHLFKRGYKTFSTKAPLRENLAAGLLLFSINELPLSPSDLTLIDPLVGSGTFLTEAAGLYKPTNAFRTFSFMHFRLLEKLQLKVLPPTVNKTTFKNFFGFDNSEEAIKACTENIKNFGGSDIQISHRDLLSPPSDTQGLAPSIVITNPPYGERLSKIPSNLLMTSIAEQYHPQAIGLLLPSNTQVKPPSEYKKKSELKIKNGSIDVTFHLFVEKSSF